MNIVHCGFVVIACTIILCAIMMILLIMGIIKILDLQQRVFDLEDEAIRNHKAWCIQTKKFDQLSEIEEDKKQHEHKRRNRLFAVRK